MDDALFSKMAETELSEIERAIERAIEAADIDCDVQMNEGGIVEVEFPDGRNMVINRHAAMQEIWLAARSGAHHFRFLDGRWRDTRDASLLREVVGRLLFTQSAGQLVLDADWVRQI